MCALGCGQAHGGAVASKACKNVAESCRGGKGGVSQAGEPVQALPPRPLVVNHCQLLLQHGLQRLVPPRLTPLQGLQAQTTLNDWQLMLWRQDEGQ